MPWDRRDPEVATFWAIKEQTRAIEAQTRAIEDAQDFDDGDSYYWAYTPTWFERAVNTIMKLMVILAILYGMAFMGWRWIYENHPATYESITSVLESWNAALFD